MADKKPSEKKVLPPEAPTEEEPSEPAADERPKAATESWFQRFKTWYSSHKKLSVPATVLAAIILILAIPWSRYTTAGLVLKKNFQVQVIDSETKSPVSGATVSLGSTSSETDGSGVASLKVKVGSREAKVSKKYYKDGNLAVVVPILSQKSKPSISLVATGRQVKVAVVNTISKSPVGGVNIKVADINGQTNSSGNVTLVLPPGVPKQPAILSLTGYNDNTVTINVSDQVVAQNDLTITPAGKVYFLSKRTGKIDVMKANLDGTQQSVVAAGTGKESDTDTILLASRDWKYLAFKSKRDDSPAKLYWIDTSVDKLNILDEGDADFTMIGWSSNYFIYKVSRNGVANWQANREALKSFNATSAKLLILNQTGGAGSGDSDWAHETYGSSYGTDTNFYIIDAKLIFVKNWDHNYYNPDTINGKQAGIYSINVDGSGYKILHSQDLSGGGYYYLSSYLYSPRLIYYDERYSGADRFLKYENGSVSQDDSGTVAAAIQKSWNEPRPTYLLSPGGKQTFWVVPRDGKSALLLADADGLNQKQVAKLDIKFQNYGFYTDNYLLISKDSDEIYIMPSSGVNDASQLIKITDYHKPAYNFYGYGGGYGGL